MAGLADAVVLLQAKNYSGTGDWLDESGNSHDGTVSGATWGNDGFTFDGITDYIEIADHADLDFNATDEWTAMVWFSVVDATTATPMVAKKTAAGNGWVMRTGFEAVGVTIDSGADETDWQATVLDGTFYVGAAKVTAANLAAYLDGTNTAPVARTVGDLTNAGVLRLGSWANGVSFWAGSIKAFALWRSALSDADLASAAEELQSGGALTLLGVG